MIEGLVAEIFRRTKGLELARPFRRLTWDEAIRRYGSDKPDLRFGLELSDCSDLFRGGAFQVFAQAVAQGGAVQALTVPGAAFSRKDLDDLVERAKGAGAKGLVWVRVGEGTLQSPAARHLEALRDALLARTGAKAGDLVLLVADRMPLAATVLGRLRVELAQRLGLIPAGRVRPPVGRRLPAGRVERGRAAVGRDAPSLHGAPGRRTPRPAWRIPAPRARRPTISS